MAVITLTTEFQHKDLAVAVIKGRLMALTEAPVIVDISHEIKAYDYVEAAFVLGSAFPHFPQGSIHIIGVDSIKNKNTRYLAIRYKNHYFIGHDNGFFSLLTQGGQPDEAVEIGRDYTGTFPEKDVFAPVAAQLYRGDALSAAGHPVDSVKEAVMNKEPVPGERSLSGKVIHIDRYGNIVTDIKRDDFDRLNTRNAFTIHVRGFTISELSDTYLYKKSGKISKLGDLLALFNSWDLLEIAVYHSSPEQDGGATSLLGMQINDIVTVQFD